MAVHPAHAARSYLAWAGLVLGLLSLAVALLPDWIAPVRDPPGRAIHERAADWLGRLTERATEAAGGTPAPPAPPEPANPWRDARLALAALVLAFAALALAVLGFARREDTRVVVCAVVVTAGAIASQYLFTALMVLAFTTTAVLLLAIAGRRGV